MTDRIAEPLRTTLHILADATHGLDDPWWIFGGAAMALAGLDELHVPDVDVLTSRRDAPRLLAALRGGSVADPGEGLFRSAVFGQVLTTPVPVDVMADMEVRSGGEWTSVVFTTRQPIEVERATVYIPDLPEQIATCRLFGRSKDLQRAERLETLIRR